MILPCNCTHKAQDELNGLQQRVHNRLKDSDKFRCTVCGATRTATGQEEIEKDKKAEVKK